jgi:hypothetical protein
MLDLYLVAVDKLVYQLRQVANSQQAQIHHGASARILHAFAYGKTAEQNSSRLFC